MANNSFYFGLSDCKIAAWNNPQNYGTAVDVESVQMMVVEVQTENGTLEGDDSITDVHAKIQALQVRFRMGFKDLDVLAVLTGLTNTDSTTTESMIITNTNMPYFAICGRIDATSGGGDMQIFVPKAKVMEGFTLSMEKGSYMTPEFTAMAVYEGSTYGAAKFIKHATAQAVTLPPT